VGVAEHTHSEMMMQHHKPEDQTAIRTDLDAIFVHWNSVVRPGWLALCRRVAGRRCQNILSPGAMFRGY
jgi:hypothetical protein